MRLSTILVLVSDNGEQVKIGDRDSNSETLCSLVFGVLALMLTFKLSFGQNIQYNQFLSLPQLLKEWSIA